MLEPEKEKSEESPKDEKVSLASFIDANQKLISVLGIFTAISVFASNLPLKPVGYALSFQ